MPITNPDYTNLDHEVMAKDIGLKVKHMPMLIASFLEESAPILKKLQAAAESKDYEAIRAEAHSIKGSAGNLRLNELADMAKELEHAGDKSDVDFEYMLYTQAMEKAILTISS